MKGRWHVVSLLKRRSSGLEAVSVKWRVGILSLAEAMRMGYCNNLSRIDITPNHEGGCKALWKALASGACPRLHQVVINDYKYGNRPETHSDDLLAALGRILCVRVEDKGCSPITSLHMEMAVAKLSTFFSHPVSHHLEVLKLRVNDSIIEDMVSEWLKRSKAPHLTYFNCCAGLPVWYPRRGLTEALCSPDVAPNMRSLTPEHIGSDTLRAMMEAIERGQWRHLSIVNMSGGTWRGEVPQRLVEGLRLHAPKLSVLSLRMEKMCNYRHGEEEPGGITAMVAAALSSSRAWPQLEELDLSGCPIGVEDMSLLTKALGSKPACNNSLKRLKLSSCQLKIPHFRLLATCLKRGSCPQVTELDLSRNRPHERRSILESYGEDDDDDDDDDIDEDSPGLVQLAHALGRGALPGLKKLNLGCMAMTDDDIVALSEALCSNHACPRLQWLSMRGRYRYMNDEYTQWVLNHFTNRLQETRGRGKVELCWSG